MGPDGEKAILRATHRNIGPQMAAWLRLRAQQEEIAGDSDDQIDGGDGEGPCVGVEAETM